MGTRQDAPHPTEEATDVSDENPLSRKAGWQEEPTVDRPINGPERPKIKPLLLLLVFIAVLALVFILGWQVLVPAE